MDTDHLFFRMGYLEGLLLNLIATASTDENSNKTKQVALEAKKDLERVRTSCPLHLPRTDQS